ncbi:MAG: precorrin-3B synthase [Reyranella sp.]|nr:precorrin-3B synthase [Reyranella sp.]
MQSGDGLIARVRPWCGAFGLTQAEGLATAAEHFGNGHIDLTRRANLQIRGLDRAGLSGLQDVVERLGLVDRDPQTEAARNIMVAPLAGIDPAELFDVRPVARALESRLEVDATLHGLPSKFGFLVDGGGTVSIAGERADISLRAVDSVMAVGLDTRNGTEWLGSTSPDAAVETALAAAGVFIGISGGRGRLRDLGAEGFALLRDAVCRMLDPIGNDLPVMSRKRLGVLAFNAKRIAVGVAAPFGRLEADQLRRFVAMTRDAGATDIRLSPWRVLYVEAGGVAAAHRLAEAAHGINLIVDPDDPILRIEACPGAPSCRSSSVDTRRDARRFAALAFEGTLHVSGCAKGCARSAPADLVLVGVQGGRQGRYDVIRNGTTRDAVEHTIDAADAGALFDV